MPPPPRSHRQHPIINPRAMDALLLLIYATSIIITEILCGDPTGILGQYALWEFNDTRDRFAWSFLVHLTGFAVLMWVDDGDLSQHDHITTWLLECVQPHRLGPGLIFFWGVESLNPLILHLFTYTHGAISFAIILVLYLTLVIGVPLLRRILHYQQQRMKF